MVFSAFFKDFIYNDSLLCGTACACGDFFISVATARHLCRGELAFSVGAGNIANAAMVPTLAVMI